AVARDRDVRDDLDGALADDLHHLQGGEALRAERVDTRAVGLGARRAGRPDGVRFAGATQPGRIRLAAGLLDLRARVQFGDAHALLGLDHVLLDVGGGGLAHELLALLLRRLLYLVRLLLFLRDLAVGERLHQLRRRVDVADQG